jgi:hypothetical protein
MASDDGMAAVDGSFASGAFVAGALVGALFIGAGDVVAGGESEFAGGAVWAQAGAARAMTMAADARSRDFIIASFA